MSAQLKLPWLKIYICFFWGVTLGHGWGSQHDPDRTECSPSVNGKFIMYAYSVSGREPNNNVSFLFLPHL